MVAAKQQPPRFQDLLNYHPYEFRYGTSIASLWCKQGRLFFWSGGSAELNVNQGDRVLKKAGRAGGICLRSRVVRTRDRNVLFDSAKLDRNV